jgi:hypothetical protein
VARLAAAAAEAAPSAGPEGLTLIDEPEVQVPARAGGHARATARAGPAPGSEDSSSSESSEEEEAGGPEGVDVEEAEAPVDVSPAAADVPAVEIKNSQPINRKTTQFVVSYKRSFSPRYKLVHRSIKRLDTNQESQTLVFERHYGKVMQDDMPLDTRAKTYTADSLPVELWDEFFNFIEEHPVFEGEGVGEILPPVVGVATDEAAQQPASTQQPPAASSSQPPKTVSRQPQVQQGGEKGWEVQVVRTMRGMGQWKSIGQSTGGHI